MRSLPDCRRAVQVCDAAAVGRTGILAITIRCLRGHWKYAKARILARRIHLHHKVGASRTVRSRLDATCRSIFFTIAGPKILATPLHQRCLTNYGLSLGHATRYLSHDRPDGSPNTLPPLRHHSPLRNTYPSPTQSIRKRQVCA